MIKPDKTNLVRDLLGLITWHHSVRTTKGKVYVFKPKECHGFFNGTLDIYGNIKKGLTNIDILNQIPDAMYDYILNFVLEDNIENIATKCISAIKLDSSYSSSCITILEKFMSQYNYIEVISKAFIYSLDKNNKTVLTSIKKKNENIVRSNIDLVMEYLNRLGSPVVLTIPKQLEKNEIIYVNAILKAFAEDAKVSVITKSDLISNPKYTQYKIKFDRYRKDFYAAEEIRESIKDSKLMKEHDCFEELKEETYDGIIDKVESEYSSSYERMIEVLNYVVTIELSSLLALIPGWVKSSQRKGICHILVNEERIKWRND